MSDPNLKFEHMLQFMRRELLTDKQCADRLTLIIEGLVTYGGECAEANYEPECCQCQNSVILRRLREDRDDWLGDMGHDRKLLKLMREAHEDNLVWDSEQWILDYGFESA